MRTINTLEMIRWSSAVPGPAGEIIAKGTVEGRYVVGVALAEELDRRGYEVTYRNGEPGGWWCWVHDRKEIETTHADHPSTLALWPLESWDDKSIREINQMPGLVARGFSADQPDALRHAMLGWLREDAIRDHARHASDEKFNVPDSVCIECRKGLGAPLPGIATRSV